MKIQNDFISINEVKKFIKLAIMLTIVLNLNSLHSWVVSKEASPNRELFVRLTSALKDIGNAFYVSSPHNLITQIVARLSLEGDRVPASFNSEYDISGKGAHRALAAVEISKESQDIMRSAKTIVDSQDLLLYEEDFAALDSLIPLTENPKSEQKVLVIGDSMLKSGLKEHLERNWKRSFNGVVMEVHGQSGTGLSRPDVYNWPSFLESKPKSYDKILFFLGTNDAQNLVSESKVVVFDTAEWRREYAARVRGLVQRACERSKDVIWVSTLKMKSDSLDLRLRALNDVVKKELSANPSCARFVSVGQWFTKKSKYTENWTVERKGEKKTIKIRGQDGIHLTFLGADLFAKKLLETIHE